MYEEEENIGVMSRMTLAEQWSRRRARNARHCVCVCVSGGVGGGGMRFAFMGG